LFWLPGWDRDLAAARQRELPRRRVLGDGRAGADIGAAGNAHRRDQRRVRADEAVVLDHRTILRDAVVIARNGARADVDSRADLRVTDVAQVIDLRLRGEPARLDFDEIADVHFLGEVRAGTQACVRSETATCADLGIVEMAEGQHLGALTEGHVPQEAVRADTHAIAESHAAFEKTV